MDELSALPLEGPSKTLHHIRTSSLSYRRSFASYSPSTARTVTPLRHVSSHNTLQSPKLNVDRPEILAPIPRRHLLDTCANQPWMRSSPPASPLPSGASLPPSSSSIHPSLLPSSPPMTTRRGSASSTRSRQPSSSALRDHEKDKRVASSPVVQWAPGTASPSTSLKKMSSKAETGSTGEKAMGRRWVRWMHKRGIRDWVLPGAFLTSALVKWCVGLGSYSGMETPPMYGDYEAQRHWMELTLHLPIKEWYWYDLPYWGLDYPPLTAYVSWLCGMIGSWIEPSWFALGKSRGIETEGSKVFMRSTVLLLDALVYVPSIVIFARTWQGMRSKRTQNLALLTLLFQPALLLIDFGHFQYNSVMLGLTLHALNLFALGHDIWGAFCFVLSLCFKQMALYYAPAIGTYLLAKCIYLGKTEGARLFVRLAAVTVSTFLILFLPFLPPFSPLSGIAQPIARIFPFTRGLFEDKVSNFWCATNVLIKWKHWVSRGALVKLSTLLTLLGFTPSVVVTLNTARKLQAARQSSRDGDNQPPFLALLPYALLTSSLSFFLFSFQVHEKTILVPLLPMTMLLSGAPIDSPAYMWGALVNNVAVFSMWPLLKRDGLGLQYIATLVLWNRLIGYNPLSWSPKSATRLFSLAIYATAIALHVLELVIAPPRRYPDLFPVLNVLVCTPVLMLAWLWSIKSGMEVAWTVGGVGPVSVKPSEGRAGEEVIVRQSSWGRATQARRRVAVATGE
ncbi:hypothetical protein AX15_002670 [Amanita polypyramis BW_CC]|nr:hypothetical protein AX15_002670 [Amanita polypyramis BW_CC]